MRVDIIGAAPGYEDGYLTDGEHWSINYWRPSTDILFNIHPFEHEYYTKNMCDIENAITADCRVIDFNSYPFDTVMQEFNTDYFGSSVDFLIAYALITRKTEIHLWGICMSDASDHYPKKCATDFWCGVAIGRGIKVVVHGNSTVMTTADGLTYGTFQPMKRQFKQI